MPKQKTETVEFIHGNFLIVREDENNLVLYEKQEKDVFQGGGRGKGRGVATGDKETRKVFLGFYHSFSAALNELVERLAEKSADVKELAETLVNIKKEIVEKLEIKKPELEIEIV